MHGAATLSNATSRYTGLPICVARYGERQNGRARGLRSSPALLIAFVCNHCPS